MTLSLGSAKSRKPKRERCPPGPSLITNLRDTHKTGLSQAPINSSTSLHFFSGGRRFQNLFTNLREYFATPRSLMCVRLYTSLDRQTDEHVLKEDTIMPRKARLLFLCLWGALLMGLVGIAEDGPTEAPAGFDTPTLTPNKSHSNGIPEPVPGDTFALDQTVFEEQEDIKAGLGPVYNSTLLCWLPSESCNRWAQPDY